MVATLLLLVAIMILPLIWLRIRGAEQRARIQKVADRIPGPKPLPIIGNLLDVGLNPKEIFEKAMTLRDKYGNFLRLWLGPYLIISLAEPKDVEALLAKNKNLSKSFNYAFLHSWIGQGLLTSSGERWKKHRKIITPTFHFNILEQFVETFNKQGDIFVSILKNKEGEPFDISPLVDLYTQDVICETAMGVELHSQTEGYVSQYLKSVKEMCEMVYARSAKPWLYPKFTYNLSSHRSKENQHLKVLHGLTDEVIQKRKKLLEEDPKLFEIGQDDVGRKRRVAFLDLLLHSSRDGSLSDEDIREEVDTFMFEGHDTTASGISFALMELSKHPEIQKKILEELQETCVEDSGNLSLSFENLNKLKYLEQVVKETLRMYPSVPVFGRQTTEDFEIPNRSIVIPPGVSVAVIPIILHRNPELYPNPDDFNPENFSPEAVKNRHPYAFVPFSAGPRNCIGQKFAMLEMKSILAKIIWNYALEIDPTFKLKLMPEITLKSLNGVRLTISPRDNK